MKRTNKKGFTIVELVIVIAVIAILAAVLIPTFSSLIKKANISNDTMLAKNMNLALASESVLGKPTSMEEAIRMLYTAGFVWENLTPTTNNYSYAWDSEGNQVILLDEQYNVTYANNPSYNKWNCYVPVDGETAKTAADAGWAIFLKETLTEDLAITKFVSIDTGSSNEITGALSMTGDGLGNTVQLKGSFKDVEVDDGTASVNQYGSISGELTITNIKVGSFHINGYVNEATLTSGKIVVENSGYIQAVSDLTIVAGSTELENNGQIGELTGFKMEGGAGEGGVVPGSGVIGTATAEDNMSVDIRNFAELCSFRDQVNGGRTFENVTVNLLADIDLSNIAWTPIGLVSRKSGNNNLKFSGNPFMGIFDGHNHTINGLTNKGFLPSSPYTYFAEKHNVETYSYGLFGGVADCEIRNIKLTNVNIVALADTATIDGTQKKVTGDSVGAIVGFVGGSLTMENCSASGNIVAFDAAGGLAGRAYPQDHDDDSVEEFVIIKNCVNNVNVTSQVKASGILGFIGNEWTCFEISDCKNTGDITANGNRQAIANGIVFCNFNPTLKTIKIANNTNSGKITVTVNTPNGKHNSNYIAGNMGKITATDLSNLISIDLSGNKNTGTYDFDFDMTPVLIRLSNSENPATGAIFSSNITGAEDEQTTWQKQA